MGHSNTSTTEFPTSSGDSDLKDRIFERLNEAGISTDRAVPLKEGTKRPKEGFTDWQNRELPCISEIDGHFGVRTGDGLTVLDIDHWEHSTDELQQFIDSHPTLTFETPHAESPEGHYWYATDESINKNPPWGEIQGDGALVAVGSEIWGIRERDCGYEDCCSRNSPGDYSPRVDRPIVSISADEMEVLVPESEAPSSFEGNGLVDLPDLPDADSVSADEGEKCLRRFQEESSTAFDCLMGRLRGGTGHFEDALLTEKGDIDRSRTDFVTVQHLYGAMRSVGNDHEDARKLAYNLYNHYCRENKRTKDGQLRKWLVRGKGYRQQVFAHAVEKYDERAFERFTNKSSGNGQSYNRMRNRYSGPTKRIAQFCTEWLSGDFPDLEFAKSMARIYGFSLTDEEWQTVENHQPLYYDSTPPDGFPETGTEVEYPTKQEVVALATEIDRNGDHTYGNTLIKLRKNGLLKMACIKPGIRYVYYPSNMEDPANAEWIKSDGEKHEP